MNWPRFFVYFCACSLLPLIVAFSGIQFPIPRFMSEAFFLRTLPFALIIPFTVIPLFVMLYQFFTKGNDWRAGFLGLLFTTVPLQMVITVALLGNISAGGEAGMGLVLFTIILSFLSPVATLVYGSIALGIAHFIEKKKK